VSYLTSQETISASPRLSSATRTEPMPTNYDPHPKKKPKSDWLSWLGMLGALLILIASSAGYSLKKEAILAAETAYLKTGISPPR
jgi:hypothetical protein